MMTTTMIEDRVDIHTGQLGNFFGTLNNKNEQGLFSYSEQQMVLHCLHGFTNW